MKNHPDCPHCYATDTRPSHPRLWEMPVLWLLEPFRCRECRERFWTWRLFMRSAVK